MSKNKGKTSESVTEKTFLTWDFHGDFTYETSGDDVKRLTKLQCKVCTENISKIRGEAKIRGISGQSLQSLINYVDGVSYIHKSNVTRHVKSGSLHDWAKRKFCQVATTTTTTISSLGSRSDSSGPSASEASLSLQQGSAVQKLFLKGAKEQHRNHFVTALMIVTKERPFSDMRDMIDLQTKNGVKFVSGKKTNKACREMVSYLAMAIRQDVESILNNCSFLACEQDGSEARKTREEKELIYVKVVIRGEPVELLLKCQRMSAFGGVNAASVKQAIDDAFKEYNISEEKYTCCLVAACADGAAVNLGRIQGALTQMKAERPWLLVIHCSAHRIELAVQDAFKESPEFRKIDDMMLNLHLFFRNSGKCWRLLLLLAEKLDVVIQRFPKAAGTRFQVHKYRALKALIVNFLPLCMFAENMIESSKKSCDPQQKAKLRGYLNQWLSYEYLASLHLYRLVLKETAHLSYVCQNAKMVVTDAVEQLQSAGEKLKNIAEEETSFPFSVHEESDTVKITAVSTNLPRNQRFKDKNQLTAQQRERAEKSTKVVRESYVVKKVGQGKIAVERMKEKLVPAIATHIAERMESFNAEIFNAFKIVDHSRWDHENNQFGIQQVKAIAEHFSESLKFHCFSLDLALMEWKALKKLVKEKFLHFTGKVSLWQQIFIHHHQQFPHILLVVELILITPYSSASVERGFSLMSRLLSNTRLNMSNTTLNDLMVLRVNVPVLSSLDPNYEDKLVDKAVDLYLSSRNRRASKAQKRPASSNTDELRSSSINTFLPVSVASFITSNELTVEEDFITYSDSDSDEPQAWLNTDSDTDEDVQ